MSMFDWLKMILASPKPIGPAEVVRRFGSADQPISEDGIWPDQGGWRIETQNKRTARLFEVRPEDLSQVMLTYRAALKTSGVVGRAYLEMWCQIPGRGDFYSKDLDHAMTGTTDWQVHETTFYLRKGQRAGSVRLNVAVRGAGTVWVKDAVLEQTPLADR